MNTTEFLAVVSLILLGTIVLSIIIKASIAWNDRRKEKKELQKIFGIIDEVLSNIKLPAQSHPERVIDLAEEERKLQGRNDVWEGNLRNGFSWIRSIHGDRAWVNAYFGDYSYLKEKKLEHEWYKATGRLDTKNDPTHKDFQPTTEKTTELISGLSSQNNPPAYLEQQKENNTRSIKKEVKSELEQKRARARANSKKYREKKKAEKMIAINKQKNTICPKPPKKK